MRVLVTSMFLSVAFISGGCVSNRYKKARESTVPPVLLNVSFPPAPLEALLNTVITYNGPGSWKRDAFWDEFVVTLRNPGNQHLIVVSADLTGYAHMVSSAHVEPWALEKESKTLEQQYKDDRIAFVRYTAPGVLILGAGAVAVASTGYIVTWGAAGVGAGAGAAAAAATVVALPLYYGVVLSINHHNKVAMEAEFNRRRLNLPLILGPGETRTGSFFFQWGLILARLEYVGRSAPPMGKAFYLLISCLDCTLKLRLRPRPPRNDDLYAGDGQIQSMAG